MLLDGGANLLLQDDSGATAVALAFEQGLYMRTHVCAHFCTQRQGLHTRAIMAVTTTGHDGVVDLLVLAGAEIEQCLDTED